MITDTNSIVQHVIQIKTGIMINDNVRAQSIVYVKKIIAGILAHAFVRIAAI